MFEQAFVDRIGRTNRPWTVVVSAAGQSIIVAGAILFTLIRTDALPSGLGRVGVPLAAPGAMKLAETPVPQRTAILVERRPLLPFPTMKSQDIRPTQAISGSGAPMVGGGNDGIPGFTGLGGTTTCIGCTGQTQLTPPKPTVTAQPTEQRPTATSPSKPLAVGGDVQSAKLIHQVKPGYPVLARNAHIAGSVKIEAIIGRDGSIQNLRLVSGHPLLARAALDAVAQWRYHPTLLNGQPVEVITLVEVNFTLAR